jgi:hypothetical protein
MSKMASNEPFGHLQHKLWSKERPEFKLTIWLPTTKSRESTRSRYVQMKCNTLLESSWGGLQLASNFIPIKHLSWELWAPKVSRVQIETVSGLLLGSPEIKSHSDVSLVGECKEYYMGEGGGFPWVRAVVSQVSPCCPWLVPTPRLIQNED